MPDLAPGNRWDDASRGFWAAFLVAAHLWLFPMPTVLLLWRLGLRDPIRDFGLVALCFWAALTAAGTIAGYLLRRPGGSGPSGRGCPWGAIVVAASDAAAGTALAWLALNGSAAFGLTVLMVTYPAASGLLLGRAWGWWWAVCLHVMALGLGSVAYCIGAAFLLPNVGQRPGHMDFISEGGVLFLATAAYVVILLWAGLPLIYLSRPGVRAAYLGPPLPSQA